MILAGTSAIVTGGAVRIGREIGRFLAWHGVNLCVHYGTSEEEASAAVNEFRQLGVKACAVSADLANASSAARTIFERAEQELGAIQILINSAAIFEAGTLAETTEESWDRHLSINLKAPFFLTQQLAARLPPNHSGAVINIVDWRGERVIPGHAAYTISKAGLIAQTKLLAQELGPNIRVNAIAPGAILPAPGASPEEFQARSRLNPLRRTGSPNDIVRGIHYLLTSDFVTGEVLHITGGEQLPVNQAADNSPAS
jgi:NAD(P)-dependent dehydrogenase (short-subunit alcohol dehydrogenase family)